MTRVYGIGNPLIDLNFAVTEQDLASLGLSKGIMHLIDEERRDFILNYLGGRTTSSSPGGDCPNTIINLGLLGVPAALSGKIGRDEYGKIYDEKVQACGVVSDLSVGTGKTGSSIIMVSPDGERTMNTYLGMCTEYSEQNVSRSLVGEADIVYFTGYLWDTQSQKDAISFAVSLAEAMGKVVAFDLADPFAVKRYREDFLWILERYVDVVFANAEELRLLFQNRDLDECLVSIGKLVRVAAIKDGPRGSYVVNDGEIRHIDAHGVEVLDTTGAGDSFASGFLYGLLSANGADPASGLPGSCEGLRCLGMDAIEESAKIASWIAGLIIRRQGAQLSLAEAAQIKNEIATGRHRRFP